MLPTSTPLRIAAAQCASVDGDLAANVATHCRFITVAAAAGVDLLLFPELSLSGYVLPQLARLYVAPGDAVLAPLAKLAARLRIAVIVGAPLASAAGLPRIGAITFCPDGSTAVYCKQHLHAGEEAFVSAGASGAHCHPLGEQAYGQTHEQTDAQTYALAICADTTHAAHARAAAATGAALYLASVLVSEAGYAADAGQLQGYAQSCGFAVLMANHGAPSGPYAAAGKSAFWAPGGQLVVCAPGVGDYLVLACGSGAQWAGQLIAVAP